MAGSLSVRKKNAEAAQKRRFEAKQAERRRANEAATANTGKLGSGIASIPGRVVNYIKSSSPASFGRDVKGIARATYEAATEDPNAFIEDAIFSPLAAIRDFGDVRESARKLRAQGRDAEAEKMEAMAGTAVLSAVPILGRPAGAATRKAIKAATPSMKVTPKAKTAPELTVTPKAKSKPPSLLSAVRVGGKTYTGPTHLDALDAIPDPKVRSQATLDANSRGFVNERGKYMDRFKAADYARNFDLFSPDAPDWAKTAPEVISENLRLPELAVTPKASTPQIAALKDVRPSTDDVFQVMDANTTAGKVTGDKMMPIDKLVGGVTEAADDARRVDQLVEQMSSPEGYVSRLIVDDAGNVIEGQHRLEALRRLGATKVPVTQYADLERAIPFADVRDAAAAQGIHPDQANQIAKQLAEIYADEGGNMAEIMNYGAPKGFEAAWEAAIGAMPTKAFADINPDLYGLRKTKDLPRLQASPVKTERFSVAPKPDKVSLEDYEGRPFIISMSDRSAAGDRITGIGNQDLNLPVDLQGGQDFMFSPTTGGLVWASEASPVSNIMNLARRLYEKTGEKPLYLPFRMGGEGSDFATMTGETMMSYADAALGKRDKADMNRLVQQYVPDFAGISDPTGYRQFADLSGAKRKQLQLDLSNTFGEEGGGLTLPMTRAMIADKAQLNKPSFFLQNVGEIDPTADVVTATGHRTYSRGVPGRGLGVLADDINVAQLLPDLSEMYQIGDPRQFRGQYADFTDYGRKQKIAEEAAMREKALRQGKTPKVYNTERGGTSKYMQSGAKFGVLTPELLRLLKGE
jgi:hypothetical protein